MRRLLAGALFAVSLVAAISGWQAYAAAAPPRNGEGDTVLPLLSPRRVPQFVASLPQEAALRDAANAVVASTNGASVCVDIERDGRTVYSRNAGAAFIPASTVKVLTATAALKVFEGDKTFRTTISADDKPDNGVVDGSLYMIGGGDPLLMTDDFVAAANGRRNVHSSMEALADRIVEAGVKRLRGDVVGDDHRFDAERYLSTWEAGYRTEGQVGPISALGVNQGFRVEGAARLPVEDPAANSASVLAGLLRQRGVTIDGVAKSGVAPEKGLDVVTRFDSLPVNEIVQEMLTESDNTTAETLVKNIGVEKRNVGSFAAGAQVVVEALQAAGVQTSGVNLVDGSGLDRSDRVTCNVLTGVLHVAGPSSSVAQGLPRAGETGTLTARFGGTTAVGRLQAKTGTLSGVTALAGWARPDGQQPFNFSVVTNGLPSDTARSIEEQIAVLLVNQAPVGSLAAFSPQAAAAPR